MQKLTKDINLLRNKKVTMKYLLTQNKLKKTIKLISKKLIIPYPNLHFSNNQNNLLKMFNKPSNSNS